MPFSLFLALRYLRPKRTVISFITLFCILGVMLGVGALIVVISVMNGFQKKIREELLRIEPHVIVQPPLIDPEGKPYAASWKPVAEKLRGLKDDAVNVSPVVEGQAALETRDPDGRSNFDMMLLMGVDPQSSDLKAHLNIVDGSFDLDGDTVLISEDTANRHGFQVGDKITLQSFKVAEELYNRVNKWRETPKDQRGDPQKLTEELENVIVPQDLTVAGIYRARATSVVIAPLHTVQEMMQMRGRISFLAITTPDALQVGRYQSAIDDALPEDWDTQNWRQRHSDYFDAVESERGMMYVVLMIIMIVAAFCIVVTLATVAIHKRREIGVIRSLGARMGQILAVFVSQGTIVGTLGTIFGVLGGLLVLNQRAAIKTAVSHLFGVEIINERVYGVSEIPVDVQRFDVLLICGMSLAISTLAGVLPALIAAAQDPAKALRSE